MATDSTVPTSDDAERPLGGGRPASFASAAPLRLPAEAARGLIDAAPDAILAVDAAGRIVLANHMVEVMFGVPVTELLGELVERLVPDAARQAHARHRDIYAAAPGTRQMGSGLDLRGRRQDGEEFPVEISLSPWESDIGLIAIATLRDVTERHHLEAEAQDVRDRFRLLVDAVADYGIVMMDPDGNISSWNEGAQRINGYASDEIVGQPYSVFFTSEDLRSGKPEALLTAARATGRAQDDGWRVREDGTRFWGETVIAPLTDPTGRLRGFANVTRDGTERRRGALRQNVVDEVARATVGGAGVPATLKFLARKARQLGDTDRVVVAVGDETGAGMVVLAADGPDADEIEGLVLTADSLPARVARRVEARRLEVGPDDDVPWRPPLAQGAPGQVVAVPIVNQGRGVGAFVVSAFGSEPRLSDADIPLLEAFASQAALALELARARDEVEALAVVEDHERIARDLHDTVIQQLFAVGMSLQALSTRVRDDAVRDRIERAVGDLDTTINAIRTTIVGVQVGRERPRDVRADFIKLVNDAGERLGFSPRLRFTGHVRQINSTIAINGEAVLRECLSNVVRHAQATRVDVLLDVGDDVVLRVSDDGQGIPPDQQRRSGLRNIVERAEKLGGGCDIRSSPGSGTVIEWRVPAG